MPVEKSGQNEFDFDYGDDFGAHIEKFDPDFSKVLVRYNPDDDAEMNERQLGRLKRLADWLHAHDRKFLFELLVPATDEQLAIGRRRHRPLRRRAAPRADAPRDRGDPERRHRGRRVEDRGRRRARGRRDARRAGPLRRGPRGRHLRAARPRRLDREGRAVARAGRARSRASSASRSAARSGGTRSRASSTRSSTARRPRRRSPTTTCTSCRSTRGQRVH